MGKAKPLQDIGDLPGLVRSARATETLLSP
jgi:hypothetical protein